MIEFYSYIFIIRTLSDVAVTIEIGTLGGDGIIDVIEGQLSFQLPIVDGFSFASIPLQVSTLTYSEYAERGFDIADDFDIDEIPLDAADGISICNIIIMQSKTSLLQIIISVFFWDLERIVCLVII